MTKLNIKRLVRLKAVGLETMEKSIIELKPKIKQCVHKLKMLRKWNEELDGLDAWSRWDVIRYTKSELRQFRIQLRNLYDDRNFLKSKLIEESRQSNPQPDTLILCT